jgi:prepilin-type N-terminal cleavage/methylation domain-containing protein
MSKRGFTIIELLVVVSIIALLVGILLPAIGKARDQARVTISQANLRNLGTAHASYAAEWADRQYTAVVDTISTYGSSTGPAFDAYGEINGSGGGINDAGNHPPTYLGYGWRQETDEYRMYAYKCNRGMVGNASLTLPIVFDSGTTYFGAFRLPNALNFSQYVSGRFYDPVFYAPKDVTVINAAWVCFDSPDQYCPNAKIAWGLGNPAWSSYCTSPAGMYNPAVMSHDDPENDYHNGWQDPWDLDAGFKSPSFSQALYPALKTHMLEHHWLQNSLADCNIGFDGGTYEDCEPYYFNHAWESNPVTLFYDGHVEGIGVRNTMRADGRMRQQTGNENWGLWSKDTVWGEDGYLIEYGYDQAASSFHILTTDGIRGRDILGD